MDRRSWIQQIIGAAGLSGAAPYEWADGTYAPGYVPTPGVFYTPDWLATGAMLKHTADPERFPINEYADMAHGPATIRIDHPNSTRYCFGFEVPMHYTFDGKIAQSPPWQKTAEHAAIPASHAMTVRVLKAVASASGCLEFTRFAELVGSFWGSNPKKDDWIADLKWGQLYPNPERYRLVMNQNTLDKYRVLTAAHADRWRKEMYHPKGVLPDRLPGVIIDMGGQWYWSGVRIVLETGRHADGKYLWPDGMILMAYCPKTPAEREKSTIRFKFRDVMTVETKPDRDNGRYASRIVEDYAIEINPELGSLIMGA